jgi:hypothetical protein
MLDLCIGGKPPDLPKDTDLWRYLDPETMQLRFWDDTFDLAAITAEVDRLLIATNASLAKPNWDAIQEYGLS